MPSAGKASARRKQALLEWLRANPGIYTPAEMFEAGFQYPEDMPHILDIRYSSTRLALDSLYDNGLVRRKKKTVNVGVPYHPVGGAGVARDHMPTKPMKVYCWGIEKDETV